MHTHSQTCMHTHSATHAYTHSDMHAHTRACVQRHTHTHSDMRAHTDMHHSDTQTCMGTHTETHTHTLPTPANTGGLRKACCTMSRSCCTMCLEPQPTPSPTAASHLTGPAPETEDVPSSLSQDPLLRSSPNMGKPLFFPSIPLVPWPGCWEVSSGIKLAPRTQTQTLASGWPLGLNPDLTDLLLPVCCWAKLT